MPLARRAWQPWLAAALLPLWIAGCAAPGGQPELYEARLDGAQEVPPVATAASGTAQVEVDPRRGLLRWTVSHGGLSGPVTGAHVHGPAGPGANAGILFPLPGASGELRITPEQYTQLESGQWYVNVHTARHPAGEIRGQLRPRR